MRGLEFLATAKVIEIDRTLSGAGGHGDSGSCCIDNLMNLIGWRVVLLKPCVLRKRRCRNGTEMKRWRERERERDVCIQCQQRTENLIGD